MMSKFRAKIMSKIWGLKMMSKFRAKIMSKVWR